VRTGEGKKLTSDGVVPDIIVAVAGADEALVFADPFAQLPGATLRVSSSGQTQASAAGRQARRRLNEAELVRLQREGLDADEQAPAVPRPSADDSAGPVVRDPALARALDLLKGISVLGQTRPR